MAIKVGAENKRNVYIAAGLFCVVAYLAVSQLMGGPSTPAPSPVKAPVVARQAPVAVRPAVGATAGPAAKKLPGSGLDPSLHLERLALSESIEYAGDGRNIFSADSAPVRIPDALSGARTTDVAAGPVVPPAPAIPTAPAIDLHYFGYSAARDGKREAFLSHGDDVFEASAGEIVNHRYKVVAVDLHSVQITDLSYNNTQTLPLVGN
jgi:hypothetical protein